MSASNLLVTLRHAKKNGSQKIIECQISATNKLFNMINVIIIIHDKIFNLSRFNSMCMLTYIA